MTIQFTEAMLEELEKSLDSYDWMSIEDQARWRFPFDAARKIKRLLLDHGCKDIGSQGAESIIDSLQECDLDRFPSISLLMEDDILVEFEEAWEIVVYPEGENPLSMAVYDWKFSKRKTVIDLAQLTEKGVRLCNCIAHVAHLLAMNHDYGEFYIPSRDMCSFLGRYGITTSHTTISSLKRRFVRMGFFSIESEHTTKDSTVFKLTEKFEQAVRIEWTK